MIKRKDLFRVYLMGYGSFLCVLFVACLFVWFYGFAHFFSQQRSVPLEKLRLGYQNNPTTALLLIAKDQGYFADEGLDVSMTQYPSGKRALSAGLFTGKEDVVDAHEVAIAIAAFSHPEEKIIATIATSSATERIIARRDHGIEHPEELKGKIVATQQGSDVHFFLHLFLLSKGLSQSDVTMIYLKAEELPQALADGTIDAFSMREPFVSQAQKLLGKKAVVFPSEGYVKTTDNLVSTEAFLKQRPESVKKFLRALIRAEQFVVVHPESAKRLIVERMGADQNEVNRIWPNISFHTSLDSTSLYGLEAAARWAKTQHLVPDHALPDYLSVYSFDALKFVRPESILIIH